MTASGMFIQSGTRRVYVVNHLEPKKITGSKLVLLGQYIMTVRSLTTVFTFKNKPENVLFSQNMISYCLCTCVCVCGWMRVLLQGLVTDMTAIKNLP